MNLAAYLTTLSLIPSRRRLCHNRQNHASSYFCHSGLDPESSAFSDSSDTGCRIKSGMTNRNQTIFRITTQPLTRGDLMEGDHPHACQGQFDPPPSKGEEIIRKANASCIFIQSRQPGAGHLDLYHLDASAGFGPCSVGIDGFCREHK